MNIEKNITYKGYELRVVGDYDPGEKEVRYYSDMSGHPGTPSSFEAIEIYLGEEPILEFLIDTNCDKLIYNIEEEVLRAYEEE